MLLGQPVHEIQVLDVNGFIVALGLPRGLLGTVDLDLF